MVALVGSVSVGADATDAGASFIFVAVHPIKV